MENGGPTSHAFIRRGFIVILVYASGLVSVSASAETTTRYVATFENADFRGPIAGAEWSGPSDNVAPASDGIYSMTLTSPAAPGPNDNNNGAFIFDRPFSLSVADLQDAAFDMRVKADADRDFTLHVWLEEDDDGSVDNGKGDKFGRSVPIRAGSGWSEYRLPISEFVDVNGDKKGDDVFNPLSKRSGGNGRLRKVVLLLRDVPEGQRVTFQIDDLNLVLGDGSRYPVADFEPLDLKGHAKLAGFVTSPDEPPGSPGFRSLQVTSRPARDDGHGGRVSLRHHVGLADIESTRFCIDVKSDYKQDFVLDVRLQEDDNANGKLNLSDDDNFSGEAPIPGATGWQTRCIALTDFVDVNADGDGVLNPESPAAGGNGELLQVVLRLDDMQPGARAVVKFDNLGFETSWKTPPPPGLTDTGPGQLDAGLPDAVARGGPDSDPGAIGSREIHATGSCATAGWRRTEPGPAAVIIVLVVLGLGPCRASRRRRRDRLSEPAKGQ